MYLTIHGHFYQPPRENPWTGEVPRQESAGRWHDWNQRITEECYAANTRSRILDPHGRITSISNNFAHISFDFGPTLLADLERRFPAVYRRILEADRESLARRGHGNAFAQGYNHMILPLANLRDKRTQVRWGLRDFEHRFGRPSDGLWLPETAVDSETLQVVAEAGVRFLVLSPGQALRWRKRGEREWRRVDSQTIDTSRPYSCEVNGAGGASRTMTVFFYDGSLAVGVSFEHLLRNAETFADRVQSAGRSLGPRGLVHFATDGEVYGHHEPFGDMCLAYLIEKEAADRGIHLVNYAEYLDLHPAEHEVELDYTDTGEGTAWSCTHGVGRWVRDCGCNLSGREGWNQTWRTPLRRGLDALRDQVQSAFLARTSPVLKDAWAARDEYIDVLLKPARETREDFLEKHLRGPVDDGSKQMVWSLLESTHQAMLMYTSCAWFFDDISGLEVQQNLAYAARACELAQPFVSDPLEPILLRHLAHARSNEAEWRDGAFVYRSLVRPRRVGPEHAAAQAVFESAVLRRPLQRRVFRYPVEGQLDPASGQVGADWTGRIRVADEAVDRAWSWAFRLGCGNPLHEPVELSPIADPQASPGPDAGAYRLVDLQGEVREGIARASLDRVLREEGRRIREVYEEARPSMDQLLNLGLAVPEIHRTIGTFALGLQFQELAGEIDARSEPMEAAWWGRLDALLEEEHRLGLDADPAPVSAVLGVRVEGLLDLAAAAIDRDRAYTHIQAAYTTLARADRRKLALSRTGLELRAWELARRFRADLLPWIDVQPTRDPSGEPPVEAPPDPDRRLSGAEALLHLAGHANLNLVAVLRVQPLAAAGPVPASTGGSIPDA